MPRGRSVTMIALKIAAKLLQHRCFMGLERMLLNNQVVSPTAEMKLQLVEINGLFFHLVVW